MTRPRGRPPLDANDPSTGVHVQLPSRVYDNLYQLARQANTSVPEIIRRKLAHDHGDDEHDDEEQS